MITYLVTAYKAGRKNAGAARFIAREPAEKLAHFLMEQGNPDLIDEARVWSRVDYGHGAGKFELVLFITREEVPS